MKIVSDFFNKLAGDLDKKYFPDVKYYRDSKNTTEIHYAVERFNNGVLTYNKFIKILSDNCSDTKGNIHKIVSNYIQDFEEFKYSPNKKV